MNSNINIYKRLNPKLSVQVGLSLDLLYWANISNISLTNRMTAEVVEFCASQGKSEEMNVLEDEIGWGSG